MPIFKIRIECDKCGNDSFRLQDTVNAKQKDVAAIAAKIASEGIVNIAAFDRVCTKCGNSETAKLIYTKDE
jgi:ribosomal protein L37E